MSTVIEGWKARARQLETEVFALYLAYKDPRTPWYAKAFTALVVGYAFSPIDLIPDFIPVFGYLDDLVIVPLGAIIAMKMIPTQVMEDSRRNATEMIAEGKPVNKAAAVVIVVMWIGLTAVVGMVIYKFILH
jgi:uncharacterized membrane protein YkvA (DUF1232 family)